QHVSKRVAYADVIVDHEHPHSLEMTGFLRAVRTRAEIGHETAGEVFARPVFRVARCLLDATDGIADLVELSLNGFEPLAFDYELLVGALLGEELGDQLHLVGYRLEWVVDLVRDRHRDLTERRQALPLANLAQVLREADRPDLRARAVLDDG